MSQPVCSYQYKIAVNGKVTDKICTEKPILSEQAQKIDFICQLPTVLIPGKVHELIDANTWKNYQGYFSEFMGKEIVPRCEANTTISVLK